MILDVPFMQQDHALVCFSARKQKGQGYVDDLSHTYLGNSVKTKTDDPTALHRKAIKFRTSMAQILHDITVVLGI